MTSVATSQLTPPQPWLQKLRQPLGVLGILLMLALVWEGYKVLGAATQGHIPFTPWRLPIRADDISMPHLWTIFATLLQPAQRDNPELLITLVARSALFTWREAFVGFALGSGLGLGLGALLGRFRLLERSLMPYLVASQTVPLLAIAPMVVIWGGRLKWEPWWSVALISAYLTFFPVTLNTLRGLRSPTPMAVELMRSYAATEWQILWLLRLPAALPYIFAALRVSATLSVVGAIVGELPTGISGGLGRLLFTFSSYYILGPEKLYATIVGAAALGLIFTVLVGQVERWLLPAQRRLAS